MWVELAEFVLDHVELGGKCVFVRTDALAECVLDQDMLADGVIDCESERVPVLVLLETVTPCEVVKEVVR